MHATRRRFVQALAGMTATPALAGTFLQLNRGHLEWPPERWTELFGYFRELRLRRVIVQWTSDEDVSFAPLLDRIFGEASGMRVTLGLRNEVAFWRRNADNRAAAFAGIFERTLPLIPDLTGFANRAEFDGWYIPQEFDDVNWSRRDARNAGGDYLRGMARALRRHTPSCRVCVSAFANGAMEPAAYARLWRDVMRHAKLDELLFQDGVGVEKLTIARAADYLRALRSELGERASAVVETLTQVRADPFEARAAEADRVKAQLESVRACGYPAPVAFSVPEYVTPLGVNGAKELFAALKAS